MRPFMGQSLNLFTFIAFKVNVTQEENEIVSFLGLPAMRIDVSVCVGITFRAFLVDNVREHGGQTVQHF